MNFTYTCHICGHQSDDRIPVSVSPFYHAYVKPSNMQPVELCFCRECDFMFFNGRPDSQETKRLYTGYRDDHYYAMRLYHEGYRRPTAMAIAKDEADRRDRIDKALEGFDTRGKSVLDYGGDRGQFFGEVFKDSNKFVFDISGLEPETGVTIIKDKRDLQGKQFDFILCNHVLEHASHPYDLVRELLELGHSGTIYYFEVPRQCVPLWLFKLAGLVKRITRKLVKRPAYDGLAARILRYPWLNEHLNLFSVSALGLLLDTAGYTPLKLGISRHIYCVARRLWVSSVDVRAEAERLTRRCAAERRRKLME